MAVALMYLTMMNLSNLLGRLYYFNCHTCKLSHRPSVAVYLISAAISIKVFFSKILLQN